MAKDLTKKDIEYLSEVIDSQYIPDKWKKKASEMVEETKSESKEKPSSEKQQLEEALKGIQVAIDIAGETKELMKAKKGIEIAINLI